MKKEEQYELSMIIIGENEEIVLIKNRIVFEELNNKYKGRIQFIYVDSNSRDNSISIVKRYPFYIQIFKITGECNAAIARNVGILHAKGKYIIFIDGDTVINLDFVDKALKELSNIRVGAITGFLDEFIYKDINHRKLLYTRKRYYSKKKKALVFGGNFITKSTILQLVGPFDERLVRHQDIDFTFRIRKAGYDLVSLNDKFGEHYTLYFSDRKRFFSDFKIGKFKSVAFILKKYYKSNFILDLFIVQRGLYFRLFSFITIIVLLLIKAFKIIPLFLTFYLLVLFLFERNRNIFMNLITLIIGYQIVIGLIQRSINPKYTIEKIT